MPFGRVDNIPHGAPDPIVVTRFLARVADNLGGILEELSELTRLLDRYPHFAGVIEGHTAHITLTRRTVRMMLDVLEGEDAPV